MKVLILGRVSSVQIDFRAYAGHVGLEAATIFKTGGGVKCGTVCPNTSIDYIELSLRESVGFDASVDFLLVRHSKVSSWSDSIQVDSGSITSHVSVVGLQQAEAAHA